jgi:hypothetical protein
MNKYLNEYVPAMRKPTLSSPRKVVKTIRENKQARPHGQIYEYLLDSLQPQRSEPLV